MNIPHYLLVNPTHEKDRYDCLLDNIQKNNITNYRVFTHCWGCDITPEIRSTYVKTDTSMRFHDRNMNTAPLSNCEISLFLNFIECLRHIRNNHDDGVFVILESDAMFHGDYLTNLSNVVELSKQLDDWDMINIGGGNFIPVPQSEPVRPYLHLYKEKRNRAADGILWNYKGICKFLDYFEKTNDIDAPFDCKIDVFSEFVGGFNLFWAHPSLTYQGSRSGAFRSHLR
jgi:hypothetical protein